MPSGNFHTTQNRSPNSARFCWILALLWPLPAYSSQFYVFQRGDTLSNVLWSLNISPLYGAKGFVLGLAQRNGFRKHGEKVQPGDVLRLEYTVDPAVRGFVNIDQSGEIRIDKKWLKSRTKKEYLLRFNANPKTTLAKSENCVAAPQPTALEANNVLAKPPEPPPLDTPKNQQIPPQNQQILQVEPISSHAENVGFSLNTFIAKSRIGASGLTGYSMFEVGAPNSASKATLLSKSQLGAELSWKILWTPQFSTGWEYRIQRLDMSVPPTGSLQNAKTTTSGQKLSATLGGENFSIAGELHYGQDIIIRAVSLGTASVEAIPTLAAGGEVKAQIAKVNALSASVFAGGRWGLTGSGSGYSVKNSVQYSGGLEFLQVFDHDLRLFANAKYKQGTATTTVSEQTKQEMITQLGISYDLTGVANKP